MAGLGSLRVGIIGAGYIAQVHSAAYRAIRGTYNELPDLTMVAVADSDPRSAKQLSDAWGWRRTEADWRDVAAAPDVDVVDICVPNSLHAEIAIEALDNGKHVICEKPLASDLASAEAMAEAAHHSDRVAQVCFYYRLWPAIAWARELVAGGEIGNIQHFRGWMLQDYAAEVGRDLGWRARPAESGAGALGDLGSHIIDVARYLCGDIASVCAHTASIIERPGSNSAIDDLASMMVEFENGATGVLEASWAMRGHKCDLGFDLVGDAGAIRFSWERANEIEILRGDPGDDSTGFSRVLLGGTQPEVARFVAVPGQGMGYRDAFTIGIGRALRAIAAGEREASPTFADGLTVSRTVDKVLESARNRGWSAVP